MARFTVYVTRRTRHGYRRALEEIADITGWDEERPAPREMLFAAVRDADALLCMGDDLIDAAVIRAAPRLRVISTATAGYDHIDLDAAQARGITVCHAPGAADTAVADMTMALVLACARGLLAADRFVRERRWSHWSPHLFEGIDLPGSTLGIVGLGHIGLQVARRARGFDMQVLYHDVRRNPDAEAAMHLQHRELNAVLREADFVTLHVPLLPATRGMIDEARLRMMRPDAWLVNMARGPVVDHDALVRALREGWIAGAALDVHDEEPLPVDDPLPALPNVVLTPHIGSNTRGAIDRMLMQAAEGIAQVLRGEEPANPVAAHAPRRAA